MSKIRVNTIQLNDAGNCSVSVANSWNVALIAGGNEVIKANYDGDILVRRSIVLTAANGAIYSISVSNDGTLTSTKV